MSMLIKILKKIQATNIKSGRCNFQIFVVVFMLNI